MGEVLYKIIEEFLKFFDPNILLFESTMADFIQNMRSVLFVLIVLRELTITIRQYMSSIILFVTFWGGKLYSISVKFYPPVTEKLKKVSKPETTIFAFIIITNPN